MHLFVGEGGSPSSGVDSSRIHYRGLNNQYSNSFISIRTIFWCPFFKGDFKFRAEVCRISGLRLGRPTVEPCSPQELEQSCGTCFCGVL